jgi:2-oxoglutarate dehydrogenase E1 component
MASAYRRAGASTVNQDVPSIASLEFLEELYSQYLDDPDSVAPSWREYFAALARDDGDRNAARAAVQGPDFAPWSLFAPPSSAPTAPVLSPAVVADLDLPELDHATLTSRFELLGRLPLFRGMPADEIAMVARIAIEENVADGAVLFREGEPGSWCAIVTAGKVVVRHGDALLQTLGVGDVVGELSVIDGEPRSADVLALGSTTLLRLERESLLALIERRPALARSLLRLLSVRLRQRGSKQEQVNRLIHAHRVRGHMVAAIDPLAFPRDTHPELEPQHYGLGEEDLDALFSTTTMGGAATMTLRQILALVRTTYCGSIGVQFMHLDDKDQRRWIIERLEDPATHRVLSTDEQVRILTALTDAEILEQFIHRKFLGAKRFSLEGAETLIPLLDLALEEASTAGVREVVIGMAHRGRLNVLVNIMGKSPRWIFREFTDADAADMRGRGDVKYHLGYGGERISASGEKVHLSLCFNPSHLEFVGPVVVGRLRAKQDRFCDRDHARGLGIVIHGDAAIAGQGVNQELFNLSALHGYRTGGTLHIVVNNQIGFTTPPESGRSTRYATDIARMLSSPIFHVNGENPEAVAQVVRMAMDYRREFAADVVVDMLCYRRHGHNEGDEPSYTQPVLYDAIRKRTSVRAAYLEHIQRLGGISAEHADRIAKERRAHLEEELAKAKDEKPKPPAGEGIWAGYVGGHDHSVEEVGTGVSVERLRQLLESLTTVPAGFRIHPKLEPLMERRREMARGDKPLDWGTAEALAFATLVTDGYPVRLSGQDSGRGTFSHRHAVLHDVETGATRVPLQHLAEGQARFHVWDSPLSEIAVLGFEYGYSLETPEGLTIWEAQFGDFCNVAQVIIDQFITSSEDKWRRLSGLTLFLPHGFEGQGPEHSSARLERFLQLAAEDNIQVANPTTPAQLFHLLRRQVLRPLRKPLVVATPKSLLRHPDCVSTLDELAGGSFQRVIPDARQAPSATRKILLTSGKVFYDLEAARRDRQADDVAIVRLELYYPFSDQALADALAPFADGTPLVWVQEEPLNMGAWAKLRLHHGERLLGKFPFSVIARPESASPATGSPNAHKAEQDELLHQAFS